MSVSQKPNTRSVLPEAPLLWGFSPRPAKPQSPRSEACEDDCQCSKCLPPWNDTDAYYLCDRRFGKDGYDQYGYDRDDCDRDGRHVDEESDEEESDTD